MTGTRVELRIDADAASLEGQRRDAVPVVLLPLDSTVLEVLAGGTRQRLDRSSFATIPAGRSYRLESSSPAPRVLTLLIGSAALMSAEREYKPFIKRALFTELFGQVRRFSRTRWFDEVSHRYLFERVECEKHDSQAARFLETEVAKELYFLGEELLQRKSRPSVVHEGDPVARRAQQLIEERLFTPLRIDALARECHASESTLLRAFRREFAVTPAAYIRARRLDESLKLLEAGRYSVGEVAARVGYESAAAFSSAFAARFGESPSRAKAPSRKRRSL
jgi:AraC-like DNA-binding protein